MRKWLAALILAAGLAHGAEIRYSVTVPGTMNVITLLPGDPCSPAVQALALVRNAGELVDQLQGGEAVFDGKRYEICFVEVNDKILVLYDDDAFGLIPKHLFTLESKI